MQGKFEAEILKIYMPELDNKCPEVHVRLELIAGKGERKFEPPTIIRTFYPLEIENYIGYVTEVVKTANLRVGLIACEEAEKCENLSEFFDYVCFEDTKAIPREYGSFEEVANRKNLKRPIPPDFYETDQEILLERIFL